MLKQFKNIDQAFKYIRTFSIVLIIANVSSTCYMAYAFLQELNRQQRTIHILSGSGKISEATAGDRADYISVEVRDHVRMFHFHFFTLDPDDDVIQKNIGKALYLADASAKRQYDNLKENGYYSNIISGNISQRIEEDSIQVRLDTKPYYFRYYGHQKIIRPTSVVTRSLVTEGYIRDGLIPSDHNPHGYLIERWATLENKDLKVESRN